MRRSLISHQSMRGMSRAVSDCGMPVGNETLAGIPVASHTTLSFMMYRCSRNGPHDDVTWRKLLGRGAIVCSRMVPRDVALVVNALQRRMSEGRDSEGHCNIFIRKLLNRHLEGGPLKCEDYNAQNISLVVHGINKFGIDLAECPVITTHLTRLLPGMNAQQLVMVAPAVCGTESISPELEGAQRAVLARCVEIADTLTSQGVSILFNCLAKNISLSGPEGCEAVTKLCSRMADSDVVQTLTPQGIALMLSGATRIHSELVSHQGASGALSSLEDMLEIAIAGITEEGEQLHTYIVSHAPLRIVSLLLSSVSRIPHHLMSHNRVKLIDRTLLPGLNRIALSLAAARRPRQAEIDRGMQSIVTCTHAMALLNIREPEIFAAFGEAILIRLIHAERQTEAREVLTPREASMILYSWAKAHIHADDLIQHVLQLIAKAASNSTLGLQEASLAAFGAGHFRVGDATWWLALASTFKGSLDECNSRQAVMFANAIVRVLDTVLHDGAEEVFDVGRSSLESAGVRANPAALGRLSPAAKARFMFTE